MTRRLDLAIKLQVGDVVEACIRQHYVRWGVRTVADGADGQEVMASFAGRGAVRFTWSGKAGYGHGLDFYFYRHAATPKPESTWTHTNGIQYRVICVANTQGDEARRAKYPPTVVYENVKTKSQWCRPLSDWHRSFVPEDSK